MAQAEMSEELKVASVEQMIALVNKIRDDDYQQPTAESNKELQSELFELLNTQKTGALSYEEYRASVQQLAEMFGTPQDPEDQVKSEFAQVDLDGDGLISPSEFSDAFNSLCGIPAQMPEDQRLHMTEMTLKMII